MESNQFDVMKETCKAKVLRPYKVPAGKRAPLITERDERQHAYRRGRGALSLSVLCTTLYSLHNQFAVCSFRCLCSGREAPATLTAPEETGLARALQEFVLWRSPSEWPCLGGGRTETWLVPCTGGTGRGARAESHGGNQDFTELRHWDRDRPRSARLSSNNNNINGNDSFVLIVSFKLYNNNRMY